MSVTVMQAKIGKYHSERYKSHSDYAYIDGSPEISISPIDFGNFCSDAVVIPVYSKMRISPGSFAICKKYNSFGHFFRYKVGKSRFECRHLSGTRIASVTSREYSNQYIWIYT